MFFRPSDQEKTKGEENAENMGEFESRGPIVMRRTKVEKYFEDFFGSRRLQGIKVFQNGNMVTSFDQATSVLTAYSYLNDKVSLNVLYHTA